MDQRLLSGKVKASCGWCRGQGQVSTGKHNSRCKVMSQALGLQVHVYNVGKTTVNYYLGMVYTTYKNCDLGDGLLLLVPENLRKPHVSWFIIFAAYTPGTTSRNSSRRQWRKRRWHQATRWRSYCPWWFMVNFFVQKWGVRSQRWWSKAWLIWYFKQIWSSAGFERYTISSIISC